MDKPLFNWMKKRAAGVLLHPTSLPNPYVIGSFGNSARHFADLVNACGFKYWQMLPLGPTGYGDSPYQSFSSHAINPLLLDLDELVENGWLQSSDLNSLREIDARSRIRFDAIKSNHEAVRRKAVATGLQDLRFENDFHGFLQQQSKWIQDYALFMALRKNNGFKPWYDWKKEHSDYETASSLNHEKDISDEISYIQFEQFLLYRQWFQLKQYANERQVEIIGDIPIYVSPDSVDVWANRNVFQVTKAGKFTKLAGVPPDYFNENGQFWGNPLYQWKELKETNYDWWIERLSHTLTLFDIVRFDHFRALAAYWSIPATATTAKEGKWIKGPGLEFFEVVKSRLPEAKFILEDLGDITPDVLELREATGCPGLAVLQFAFGGGSDNFYLPHNIQKNTVVYTGTHDNDTSRGWYITASEREKDHFRRYFRVSGEEASWDMIRAAYASVADLCIVPVQDLLAMDSDARMNIPGDPTGNWAWRLTSQQMCDIGKYNTRYLRELSELYRRTV